MTHRQLYGLAALLWLIAGVNVLRIGLVNWPSETNILVSILWLIGSLAFFAGFIFPRVVKRNLTPLDSEPKVPCAGTSASRPPRGSSWRV